MKVKYVSRQQYLDLAALGMPVWSHTYLDDSTLLRILLDPAHQEVERKNALVYSRQLSHFATLVDDDSDDS